MGITRTVVTWPMSAFGPGTENSKLSLHPLLPRLPDPVFLCRDLAETSYTIWRTGDLQFFLPPCCLLSSPVTSLRLCEQSPLASPPSIQPENYSPSISSRLTSRRRRKKLWQPHRRRGFRKRNFRLSFGKRLPEDVVQQNEKESNAEKDMAFKTKEATAPLCRGKQCRGNNFGDALERNWSKLN